MTNENDYKFRDELSSENETTAIELTGDTVWKGVIYRYTVVGITEDGSLGNPVLKFKYDLIKIPEGYSEDELRNSSGFTSYLGTILNSLILDWVTSSEVDAEIIVEEVDNE